MATASLPKRRDLLRGTYLFSRLEDDEADAILAYARIVPYAAGAEIFGKGAPGDSMMAVLSGHVRISAPSAEGREVVFNIMGPGEVFGEIALLDGGERTADAVAMSACQLLVVDRRSFLPILQRRPDLGIRLMVLLCERLRRTDEQVEDALFRHLENRLAKAVLRLARQHGSGGQPPLRIDLALSQGELASIAGGSRESINKHLRAWQRAGIIALDHGGIVIRDLDALTALA
jgi:CRP/FNR family transcriptional regulator, cyclic AMP receptor protein